MTPQELKNSILQLAIQGKLVEQRPEEETAEELFREIQKEKQALIKAGKIKKEKPLPEITEEELPFDIPETWKWVRPQDFASVVVGATPSTSNPQFWSQGTIPWLPSGCCQDCEVLANDSSVRLISEAAFDSCSTKRMPVNTIMIALTGATAGKVGLLRFEACGNQSVVGISPFSLVLPEFVFYQFMGRRREILSDCVGSAQPHISKEYVIKMAFPLPPLAEQKRIVAKIEELLPLVDRYEKAWTRLEDFNKRFPGDMQKSILQKAIQGKLVEQRHEEGTGEELYQQIQKEKQALIKAGKIKKEKPLPEISEDEIPFEIPESWKWVRLGSIIQFLGGFAYKSTTYVPHSNYQIIRLGNVKPNQLLLDVKQVFIPGSVAAQTEEYRIKVNDILVTMTGTRKKRDYFYTLNVNESDLSERSLFLNQRVGCLRAYDGVFTRYLLSVLQNETIKDLIFAKETGTANQGNIGSEDMKNCILIPLPPLSEQKRIVARLEELLPLCERLK